LDTATVAEIAPAAAAAITPVAEPEMEEEPVPEATIEEPAAAAEPESETAEANEEPSEA